MKIRKAKIEDLKEIQKLHHELLKLEAEEYSPTIKSDWSFSKAGLDHLTEAIKNNNYFTLVCEDNNTIVGFLVGSFKGDYPIRGIKMAELNHLFLEPAYREHEIGRQLAKLLKKWAKKKGATELDVGTHLKNKRAIHFYEELGFDGYGLTLIEKI